MPHFFKWAEMPGSSVSDATELGKMKLDLDKIKFTAPDGITASFSLRGISSRTATLATPFLVNVSVSRQCRPQTHTVGFTIPVESDTSAKVHIEVSFTLAISNGG